MQIEVLGTEFNVRYHEDAIETALFSGAVRLTSEALKEDYRLYPGKKSIYKLVSHQFKICDNDVQLMHVGKKAIWHLIVSRY